MDEPFPIIEVRQSKRRDVEQLGSKPKFWFDHEGEKWLFKEARENTGEDWAEKIASELAEAMGLPTHRVELASYQGRPGCAVRSFLGPNQMLVHGNEVLGGMITGYDKLKQRGQSDHTFDRIVEVLGRLFPVDKLRTVAASRMAGYLVLDALIGNSDRHHENWGIVVEPRKLHEGRLELTVQLAPTFDHASSLGRELTDEARARRLAEGTVERYIRKARGGIFNDPSDRHGMSPMAAAEMLAQRYRGFFSPWQARVGEIDEKFIVPLVRRVPDSRISQTGRAFVLAFLDVTRRLIRESR